MKKKSYFLFTYFELNSTLYSTIQDKKNKQFFQYCQYLIKSIVRANCSDGFKLVRDLNSL